MSESVRFDGELITSRQNRRIVELMKLDDRRAREHTRRFRFDGVKLLCEAIRRGVELDSVFVRAGAVDKVEARMAELYGCSLRRAGCPVFGVEDGLFEKISQENAPEGVITVAKYIDKCHRNMLIYNKDEFDSVEVLRSEAPVVLLESVRDPLNVGAIIRSAAALGVGHLILSADCADIYHPRTVRAAMGPLFSMTMTRVEDLAGSIRALRAEGRAVYAAALDDTAIRLGSPAWLSERAEHAEGGAPCTVIGNEGHGLSAAVVEACTRSVYIPMEADTESLNAGVAAALLMWEMRKGI